MAQTAVPEVYINQAIEITLQTQPQPDSTMPTPNLFVVPEYLFGTLDAMTACFVGFAIFKKRSSLPNLNH
jgi:hypothetical protein